MEATGSWILSAVAMSLLTLSFFVIRFWLEKQAEKMDELEKKVNKRFEDNQAERNRLKVLYLDEKTHKFICGKTQAEFKLHVSEEAEKNRKVMMVAIESNRSAVEAMIVQLRRDLKKNGVVK